MSDCVICHIFVIVTASTHNNRYVSSVDAKAFHHWHSSSNVQYGGVTGLPRRAKLKHDDQNVRADALAGFMNVTVIVIIIIIIIIIVVISCEGQHGRSQTGRDEGFPPVTCWLSK